MPYDYHVGPAQEFKSLLEVPWPSLIAGDKVYLHARSTPYREKIIISTSGVSLIGVPDPVTGWLPEICGENAVSRPDMNVPGGLMYGVEQMGPILISRTSLQSWFTEVSDVTIQNIRITKAHVSYQFTNSAGAKMNYVPGIGVWINSNSRNVLVENCQFEDVGEGVFNKPVAYNLRIRLCSFDNYGISGSFREHGVYVEGSGTIVEFCRFGAPRPGMKGSCLKDRSAGTIIRWNLFVPGPLLSSCRHIDLVDYQDGGPILRNEPGSGTALLHGNVHEIVLAGTPPQGGNTIHDGGDSENPVLGTIDYRRSTTLRGNKFVVKAGPTYTRVELIKFDAQAAPIPNPNNVPVPANTRVTWDDNDIWIVGNLAGGYVALSTGPGTHDAASVNRMPLSVQGTMTGVPVVAQSNPLPDLTKVPTGTTPAPVPTPVPVPVPVPTPVPVVDPKDVEIADLKAQIATLTQSLADRTAERDKAYNQLQTARDSITSLQGQVDVLTPSDKAKGDRIALALSQAQNLVTVLGG